MNILFVDNEPKLLEAIERMLFDRADEWNIRSATTAPEALRQIDSYRFDVVVSDVRMPGADGVEFLQTVHARCPQAVRIVLTGVVSEEYALRALPIAHQFLSKPCSAEELTQLIERTHSLLALLSSPIVRDIVGNVEHLPPLPETYQRLSVVLANPRAGAEDAARIIREDPAIAAKLLQVVNSSFFARRMQTSDVCAAIVHLGLRTVRSLVLQAELFGSPLLQGRVQSFALRQLQERSTRVAGLASRILGARPGRDEAFMSGLLCDVGQLVLAMTTPDLSKRANQLATTKKQPLQVAERDVLGAAHPEVGAFLLGVWGLPHTIVEAVAAHHDAEWIAHPRLDVPASVFLASALIDGRLPDDSLVARWSIQQQLPKWQRIAEGQA